MSDNCTEDAPAILRRSTFCAAFNAGPRTCDRASESVAYYVEEERLLADYILQHSGVDLSPRSKVYREAIV